MNDPIIESSSNLTFAPYNFKYPHLKIHSEEALLVGVYKDDEGEIKTKVNCWNRIFDFTEREDGKKNM